MDYPKEIGGLRWRKTSSLKPINVGEANARKERGEEEEEELLSPAARLFHEPNFNVYIIAILGCKTRIDPDLVRAKLPHTLLKHPRFSSLQVPVEGGKEEKQLKWVPSAVNLDNHVIVPPEIDQSTFAGDADAGKKFVEDYISDLTKTKIDGSKQPLWDLHLLNVRTSEPDAEAVGVFRIHHSLGDGVSLTSLLLACTRQIADPDALPTIPTPRKKKEEGLLAGRGRNGGVLGRGFWRAVVAVWTAAVLMWNTAVDVAAFLLTAIWVEDTKTPLKGPHGVEFLPRRFVWKSMSLDDFKLVKNAMNATINDVALGATQAGLSRYLNRKLDMMEKDTEVKWGNWIGFILLPFTIGIRDDPLDYVRQAKAVVDRKKRSLEALFTFSIAEFVLKLFGTRRSNALSHRIITRTTLCFTNLVGPLEEIGYYGHPLAFLAPSSFNQPHVSFVARKNQIPASYSPSIDR
ncbi:unnamed protein product [Linum tenue]|uniref:Diacylglycerol O-acyltransferase n=2 Tax=Linum tenue TaxID=586396 RepID=A0AAV0RVQ2_9ROSI|nr:unnamed protein product [Linum tenue]